MSANFCGSSQDALDSTFKLRLQIGVRHEELLNDVGHRCAQHDAFSVSQNFRQGEVPELLRSEERRVGKEC